MIDITLSDLKIKPCKRYYEYIKLNYGDSKFNPIDVIEKLKGDYNDVSWLIAWCKYAQTPEMVEYYKSLNPDDRNVGSLIKSCEYVQTPEMIDYYKSLNPDYNDVRCLIEGCKYAQTPEMIENYKSLNPDSVDVLWLIGFLPEELKKYLGESDES